MSVDVRVLVISGSMGAGKTTVLGEASDILAAAGMAHAAIDLDALGVVHLPAATPERLMFLNLASVWSNYAVSGVRRLLIAGAIESAAERERLHQAVPRSEIVVCRLRADIETMQQRVRMREPGMLQETFVKRVAELAALLDGAHVEDFTVEDCGRTVTEIAREVLVRAGWLLGEAPNL